VDEDLIATEPQFTTDQRFCIADCTTKYKDDSEWLAFWDVDEFAFLPEGHNGLPDLISLHFPPLFSLLSFFFFSFSLALSLALSLLCKILL
jgi:Glycosyltransferase family 92